MLEQPILRNNPYKVAIASMMGTAIEFYDYYIYATAAVLVFNMQFFAQGDDKAAILKSLSTLALAFIARPIGSALFGHFGDKIGRKKTLVASLLLMGLSTAIIGLLPTYQEIGIGSTILLCLCRLGQGLGLGGEWGGAALVATENAPEGKRAWFGTFPQLGAPIGLFLANGVFFILKLFLNVQAMTEWGWRIPFLLSFILVLIGLWMRLTLHESHVYREAEIRGKTSIAPVREVLIKHWRQIVLGMFIMVATYVLFYIMTAFAQVYSKSPKILSVYGYAKGLGIDTNTFTGFLLISSVVFGVCISLSGVLADKVGRKRFLIWITLIMVGFALSMPFFLINGTKNSVLIFLLIGFTLMGLTFGPMAALLPELFPTSVRYSGASLAYNFASVVGASVATLITIELNEYFGIWGVSIYFVINCVISLLALIKMTETKNSSLLDI